MIRAQQLGSRQREESRSLPLSGDRDGQICINQLSVICERVGVIR